MAKYPQAHYVTTSRKKMHGVQLVGHLREGDREWGWVGKESLQIAWSSRTWCFSAGFLLTTSPELLLLLSSSLSDNGIALPLAFFTFFAGIVYCLTCVASNLQLQSLSIIWGMYLKTYLSSIRTSFLALPTFLCQSRTACGKYIRNVASSFLEETYAIFFSHDRFKN